MSEIVGQNPQNWDRLPSAQRNALSILVEAYSKIPWITKVVAVSRESQSWNVSDDKLKFTILAESQNARVTLGDVGRIMLELIDDVCDPEVIYSSGEAVFLVPDEFERELGFLKNELREVLPLWERPHSDR